MSIEQEHKKLVKELIKNPLDIIDSWDYVDADLIHSVMGISGEAGELLDAIKKTVMYRKPLDIDNVIEELGDLEFYMENLRSSLDISREETLQANIDKLNRRYSSGYTDQAAQDRADKEGE